MAVLYHFGFMHGVVCQLENKTPRPQQPYISLQQGLPLCQVIAPDSMTQAFSIVLSSAQDRIIWRWSVHGLYTTKSIYTKMMEVGMIKDECSKVWRYKVPQTVRIFAYLLFKGRILTRDVLQQRGIPCQIDCVLCTTNAQETASHLLFECTYTAQPWNELGTTMDLRLPQGIDLVQNWWKAVWRLNSHKQEWKTRGPTLLMCAFWYIWCQRNEIIFANKKCAPPRILVDRIGAQYRCWMRCC